ncbi:MAG: amino acid ABC transporter substrate-binding protein, partial [Prochlorotrichaceae cyanobacterium]
QGQILAVANAPGTEVSDVCQGLALVREGQDINYQGASGDLELDEWGDVAGAYDVWQIQPDGTLAIVETIAVGE